MLLKRRKQKYNSVFFTMSSRLVVSLIICMSYSSLAIYFPCTTNIGSNGICTTKDECLMQEEKGFDCPSNFICCPKVSHMNEIQLRQDQTCLNQINPVEYTNNGPIQSNQYAWMVLLRYHDTMKKRHFYGCIGSLVSRTLVLTSAHCITGLDIGVKLTSVRMGMHDLGIDCPFNSTINDEKVQECSGIQDFPIIHAWYPNEGDIVYEKDLKGSQFRHDIGLIVIKGMVSYTTKVISVCFLNIPVKLDEAKLVISGWKGDLNTHEGQTHNNLQQKTVKVIKSSLCDDAFTTELNEDKQLCIEEELIEDQTCDSQGESGTILHLIRDDKISVYAISSYGQNVCQNGVKLRVYTIVQPYIELMQEKARELGVHDLPMTIIEVF